MTQDLWVHHQLPKGELDTHLPHSYVHFIIRSSRFIKPEDNSFPPSSVCIGSPGFTSAILCQWPNDTN